MHHIVLDHYVCCATVLWEPHGSFKWENEPVFSFATMHIQANPRVYYADERGTFSQHIKAKHGFHWTGRGGKTVIWIVTKAFGQMQWCLSKVLPLRCGEVEVEFVSSPQMSGVSDVTAVQPKLHTALGKKHWGTLRLSAWFSINPVMLNIHAPFKTVRHFQLKHEHNGS